MYPEDQEPPAQPDKTLGAAPKPFIVDSPQGQPNSSLTPLSNSSNPSPEPHKGPNWVMLGIIGGIILLLLAGLGTWFLMNNKAEKKKDAIISKGNKDKKTASSVSQADCAATLRLYQNEDLDIKFCYPDDWGDVRAEDAKFDPSDDGTRVRLTFTDKSAVHVGLVSDDWSTDAARESTCIDLSVQAFPDTSTFSARWATDPATGPPMSALKGLEMIPGELLIQEQTDGLLTNGICLEGYKAFGGAVYRIATATYYAAFSSSIASPEDHIVDPTELIPATDRTDFIAFIKSVERY
ncbi:MAG TPA: hypothetical protein VFM05_04105 [Candidatus Saccharimonadales bacterium]|nr:hypothetical protein [Candidatus Saccharimonadales bacterium]